MKPLSRTDTVVAVRDQVSCTLQDEAVVLHLGKGVYYGLNPVGATVWNALQEPKTIEQLVHLVTSEYQVPAGECERDLLTLLARLQEAGLVEVVGG
ncbi:MAG: PqqD family protein [Terriglobales bacterium]